MKNSRSNLWVPILAVIGWSFSASVASAAEPAKADPYANETREQRDARLQWWREARFGMFIHWGVYSVPAGTYHGKKIDSIGEWIMYNAKIPCAEYQGYAKEFNPVKYDAEEWVRIAKEAGMKYIVITSKHHDGFAMFDSKASDWNIMKASPFGRDPLKELAAACQKHGIRLGFYYSQAQDWNNVGGGICGQQHWDLAHAGNMDDYIRNVAVPQVREILSNYGKISVLWWDTPCEMNEARASALVELLKLQPGIIHNNRLGGGYNGDSETPEQFVPATGYPGRDWETCMTMNDTWGYKSYDQDWKSVDTLIRNLVDIASKGGNYLLNVGPTSEGLIPGPSVERLKAVGRWMRANGEAIYATSASPFKRLAWGRCTRKMEGQDTTLYLHVFDWPASGTLLIPGLKNRVTAASLLVGGAKLRSQGSAEGVTLSLPASAPDPVSSTIVLKIQGPPEVEEQLLQQAADGLIALPATEATTHGEQIRFEGGHERDSIGYWTNPADWVEWQFQLKRPGKYRVTAEIAAVAGGSFTVSSGESRLEGKAPVTGEYGKFEKIDLGVLELPTAGTTSIAVRAVAGGWNPFNLKSLVLQPAN